MIEMRLSVSQAEIGRGEATTTAHVHSVDPTQHQHHTTTALLAITHDAMCMDEWLAG